MEIIPSIFRLYDIRGKYPEELNEESAFRIGQAFALFLKTPNPKIVVGRDDRLSSESLFESFVRGVLDKGGSVTDIGLSTTPMLYWARFFFGFDGGVEITASHNPPQYNGFKMVKKGSVAIRGGKGLNEIKEIAENLKELASNKKIKVIKKNITNCYLDSVVKGFNLKEFRNFLVVADTVNGVSGPVLKELFKRLPFKKIHLFEKLDGSFPNHDPDPLIEKNLDYLKKEVLKKGADFGIAFDGDGDRIIFVDENGETISGDLMLALISKKILGKNPGEKILYDIRSSNIVKEVILENGGTPVLSRVGHAFIKEKMEKENVLFGGEVSGHFYHRENYFYEVPFFVFLTVGEILSETGKPLSELIRPFRKYYASGEINLKIENREEKIKKVKECYEGKGGKISELDGLRVDFPEWWVLIRPSNTEPILRLTIEAKTERALYEKKEELLALLEK